MSYTKGINLGGYLSQCEHSQKQYETFITETDIQKISSWGMDHVRLPIDYEVVECEDGTVKEENYRFIDQIIRWCEQNQLSVILDLHKTAGYDFNDAGIKGKNSLFDDKKLQERFFLFWERMAERYGNISYVAFELLNEVVNSEYVTIWNQIIKEAVTRIRQISPNVFIIYGGVEWNSAKRVSFLEPPMDANIMFTFHYYEPLLFTHQKAHWLESMNGCKDIPYTDDMEWFKQQSEKLGLQGKTVIDAKASRMGMEFHEEMLKEALDYAKKLGVTLYCGEFGVIDQTAPSETLKWFQDIFDLFHKYGIGYAIWTYKEKDFGIAGSHYDSIRQQLLESC